MNDPNKPLEEPDHLGRPGSMDWSPEARRELDRMRFGEQSIVFRLVVGILAFVVILAALTSLGII